MKRFNYKARGKDNGKLIKGNIQAENEQTAGRLLIEQGFTPLSIVEEGGGIFGGKERIKNKDRVMFTRQLSTLIGAGLPLATSLRTVIEQTENKAMKAIAEEILTSVESGKSLYESFAAHPDTFNGVYTALIQAGETSGTLDLALKRLADQEEKDAAMMSKIKGALVYPGIILCVIIAVLAFMMIAVVPQVKNLYEDMGKELPGLTQFLVNLTDFFGNFWWLVLIVVLAIGGSIFYFVKYTPLGHKVNKIIEDEYAKSLDIIKGGKALSEALRDREYMLPLVPQMASIGEESGKIDEMLGKAAAVYETELDNQINGISTMIEPILMVIMAGLIGVVVGGTLLPIYSLVNSVAT